MIAVVGLAALPLATSERTAGVKECKIRVIQPVIDDLGNSWQPRKVLPVTIERDNASGGAYCASGGSCVPRKLHGNNAAELLNCKVGGPIGGGDHSLLPNAHQAGAAVSQAMHSHTDIERQLSNLGFSNASAAGLAEEYLTHPRSKNSLLVARSLAGSPTAIVTLKQRNP